MPLGVRVLTLRGDVGRLPPEIGTLLNLETLLLDRTNLSILPGEMAKLKHLKVLYLGGNPRLDLGKALTLLATLPALERLGLDDNGLSEVPPEVGGLVKLRTLSLSKNVLTTLPPEFGRLTGLVSLNLVQNEFTDVPAILIRLPRLKTVYVSGNLIDSDRAARFRSKAPQVSISWHVQDEPYFH